MSLEAFKEALQAVVHGALLGEDEAYAAVSAVARAAPRTGPPCVRDGAL